MSYVVQSILLRRDKFSKGDAFKWIRDHGYKATKVDVAPNFYRFRQQDPDRLRGGRFRTIGLGDKGEMVIAYF
jgi:hypothetical protein